MKIDLKIEIEFDEDELLEERKGKFARFLNNVPILNRMVKNKIRYTIAEELKLNLEKELNANVKVYYL